MKILKVFGVVVGIHLFALVLIFANPGCTSTTKPTPTPLDTVTTAEPPPSVIVPTSNAPAATPLPFDPNAPAVATIAQTSSSPGFRPTRPGTSAATTLTAPPVSDVTPASTYTVQSGDSLWTIGKRNGLTPAEVAALFRVDPKTVTRWAKAGKLTSIRTLGGHRRYREAEVRALLSGIPQQRG